MAFNLDNYETVEDRLVRFWNDHPNGRIFTEMVHYDDNKVVFKTSIYFDAADEFPKATGFAEEVRGASPVNKTSHLENAETSSTGRGLANCGYAPKGARPSREEMEKVARGQQQAAPAMSVIDNVAALREITNVFKSATVYDENPGSNRVRKTNDPASAAQVGKIVSMCMSQNYKQEERLELASSHTGRPITDLKQLNKQEASELISLLGMAPK
jgi:hypothetical protein